jgi:6-phosphogluconolactonase
MLKGQIQSWDSRRDLIILNTPEETIQFAKEHWIHSAMRAIQQKGRFAVALSGGSTPKQIYQALSHETKTIDWSQVLLFWSDERAVPLDHPDSNYHMAMESGLKNLPLVAHHIFPMPALDGTRGAANYEELIRRHLDHDLFDLVMLGLGEDGHTASLFPNTSALAETEKLISMNEHQGSKRMTFTFPCIQQSHKAVIYALGKAKSHIIQTALNAPIISPWPASCIGTAERKALWVLDADAAKF